MSGYLFSAIKMPPVAPLDEARIDDLVRQAREARLIVDRRVEVLPISLQALENRQCCMPDGETRSRAFSVLSMWPMKAATRRSAWMLSGLNQGAAASAQLSTVTGTLASMQANIALLARALAVTVSIIWRCSSSVISRLLSKTSASTESGGEGKP